MKWESYSLRSRHLSDEYSGELIQPHPYPAMISPNPLLLARARCRLPNAPDLSSWDFSKSKVTTIKWVMDQCDMMNFNLTRGLSAHEPILEIPIAEELAEDDSGYSETGAGDWYQLAMRRRGMRTGSDLMLEYLQNTELQKSGQKVVVGSSKKMRFYTKVPTAQEQPKSLVKLHDAGGHKRCDPLIGRESQCLGLGIQWPTYTRQKQVLWNTQQCLESPEVQRPRRYTIFELLALSVSGQEPTHSSPGPADCLIGDTAEENALSHPRAPWEPY